MNTDKHGFEEEARHWLADARYKSSTDGKERRLADHHIEQLAPQLGRLLKIVYERGKTDFVKKAVPRLREFRWNSAATELTALSAEPDEGGSEHAPSKNV